MSKKIIILLVAVILFSNSCSSKRGSGETIFVQQEIPSQISSTQESSQNYLLYGTWVNEDMFSSNIIMFLEPDILYEEGGTSIVGGRQSFTYSFDGNTLTISQGNNDYTHTPVTIDGDVLSIGPFEGDNDWHYNLFLWGNFRKVQG